MTLQRRWLWQTLVWGLYCAFSVAMVSQYVAVTSAIVWIMVLVSAGLFATSETLRAAMLSRGWLDRAGWPLLWRLLLWVPLGATLIQGVSFVLIRTAQLSGWITFPPGTAPYTVGAAAGYVANTAIMLWLWCGAWLSWQYLQRYRQGEIAKWRAEAAQSRLELDVLKGQINPHFMFNALNNLRALINEDTDKARDMVTRLSNILRHALYHSQRDRVSVAEELAVVHDYIALEQVHYENCLAATWDVADDVGDATLPPMLLQLLVENAVKHGIAKTVGGGVLSIAVRRDSANAPAALIVSVRNPGHWAPTTGADGGVGLHNVRERLQRVCGPLAQCHVKAQDGSVCVELRIPQ